MCGRFTLTKSGEEVAAAFGLDEVPELGPRYNVAPSQPVAVVRRLAPEAGRTLAFLRWGFVPRGSEAARPLLNARAETAGQRAAFREAFARRRCLLPADGFYEWQGPSGTPRRQPFHLQIAGGALFALAGLWEPAAEAPGSVAILTTAPNSLVARIHDRMPLVLNPADYERWLDPGLTSAAALRPLLGPYPAAHMTAWPVGPAVNNPRIDDRSCLASSEASGTPRSGRGEMV